MKMGTTSIGSMMDDYVNATTPLFNLPSSTIIINNTATTFLNPTNASYPYCDTIKDILTLDSVKVVRVAVVTSCFILSLLGNLFVLSCVFKKSKTSHIHLIMLHLTLADLAFTWFNMTLDTIWALTVMWRGGDFMCRFCQILRAFGIYISAFMVVVTAFDRCFSIVMPMTVPMTQRQRTRIMLVVAWVSSFLCAIPAGVMYSVSRQRLCPIEIMEEEFVQCIDFNNNRPEELIRKYNFYVMTLSFVFPLICIVVSYGLVICEISKMAQRDRAMMQRRDSSNSVTILRARRKTLILTSLITGSFLLLWGPFYVFGIYAWFNTDFLKEHPNNEVAISVFLLMYVHPTIHPIMYGVWIREVRDRFWKCLYAIERFITCHRTRLEIPNQHPAHICCIKRRVRRQSYERSLVTANHTTHHKMDLKNIRNAKSDAFEHRHLIKSIQNDKTTRSQSLAVNGNHVHWPEELNKEDNSRNLGDSGIGR